MRMFDEYKVFEGNFRNYDVRGEYDKEIDESTAYAVAFAYAKYTGSKEVAVGMDMRTHSPALKAAFIEGVRDAGVSVEDIGLTSTDGMYFATWFYKLEGGVMITASHMEQQFNGFKFLNREYLPIGRGTGMEELYRFASAKNFQPAAQRGKIVTKDIWEDYVAYVRSFVDVESLRRLKIVLDPGNGMGWYVGEKVFAGLNLDMTIINGEPDGTFPNHVPNPILPENRVQLVEKVREIGADAGIAPDADCDRVYFVDEHGTYIDGDFVTVLLAKGLLKQNPGAGIVYDIRASHAVPEHVRMAGGIPYDERVGHSFIKARMKKENALFGGEVSGHYYFRSNAYAENGFVAMLLVLDLMSREEKPFSEIVASLGEYHVSGEINSTVKDQAAVMEHIAQVYADAKHIDRRDGISIEYDDWHFNVRPSANDPVIRLNLEAVTRAMMKQKRDEVLALIRAT